MKQEKLTIMDEFENLMLMEMKLRGMKLMIPSKSQWITTGWAILILYLAMRMFRCVTNYANGSK